MSDKPSPSTPPASPTGPSILAIEDDLLVREVYLRFLGEKGYRVIAVGDGRKALERYAENEGKFDLIISDFAMAGMSVQQIHEGMKKSGPVPKFLICSGALRTFPDPELEAIGITEYLRKPFQIPELIEKVGQLVRSGSRKA